jgi:hypothetical protein
MPRSGAEPLVPKKRRPIEARLLWNLDKFSGNPHGKTDILHSGIYQILHEIGETEMIDKCFTNKFPSSEVPLQSKNPSGAGYSQK